MKTLVVNIFAGPGVGKSTMQTALFTELKYLGINCEISTEYAKEKVWREHFNVLDDQLYILGKQHHRLWTLNGKVEVIITDAPLLASCLYSDPNDTTFNKLVVERFNNFNNLNFLLTRKHKYQAEGRYQDEEGAKKLDKETEDLLINNNIEYKKLESDKKNVKTILNEIVEKLELKHERI